MVSETYKNSQDQALEERLSNMHEQMAGVTSRLDQTERALDLERATREDIIKAEVERRMREAEERIRKEIEAEYADERAVMDKERQAIDRQREEMLKAFELMQQKLVTETEQKIRKAKDEAESHFLGKMAAQTEGFLRLFSEMTHRNNADIQSYLAKFKAASEDAQAAIGNEIKTRLERIFKNEQSKNRQIAELVRMIFTQKRERFLVSEEDRTGVHNQLLASLKFNEEEANYKKALETVKKYRLQKEACRLARKEQHVHEELIWKSYASNKLLSQIEVRKYMDHMPFNRQIGQMKRDGLVLARTTINDWHVAVCDTLVPLYRLQEHCVMRGLHLAADGSPMPVVDNEKHKTVKKYIIAYRNIDTGIPIFLTAVEKVSGRGKRLISSVRRMKPVSVRL